MSRVKVWLPTSSGQTYVRDYDMAFLPHPGDIVAVGSQAGETYSSRTEERCWDVDGTVNLYLRRTHYRDLIPMLTENGWREYRKDEQPEETFTLSRLTAREREVLTLLANGRSRKAIAEQLHISPNTVRTHVQSVLNKTGANSAIAAINVARRAGLEI